MKAHVYMYIYTCIASGCVSRPPEECDPPTASLPETEVTTRVSKRGTATLVSKPDPPLPKPKGAATTVRKGTSSKTEGN